MLFSEQQNSLDFFQQTELLGEKVTKGNFFVITKLTLV
jgi:hypothetical protein